MIKVVLFGQLNIRTVQRSNSNIF